jgi:aspartokinase-like uncharacterized kinase
MSDGADGILVVKLGGSLAAIPGALDSACAAVSDLARRHRLVVVPGGGPFADAVREFDRREGLGDDAAHWMAILAMDQYAHVLAKRIDRAVLVEEPGGIGAAVGAGRPAVLAPYRWMRSADVLPHSWDATSDSVAAFTAGRRSWWTGASCGCSLLISPGPPSSGSVWERCRAKPPRAPAERRYVRPIAAGTR